MHKFVLIMIGCFLTTMLGSCSSYQTMVNHAQQKTACKTICQERFHSCRQRCHNSYQQCNMNAYDEAIQRYKQYKHEQCVKGESVVLELKSFRDPLQCIKITCECSADLLVCKQSCAGKIRKRLQVPPAC